ncbi:MAG: MBL fold metallo-hydrolase, partial [Candidatus Bathyarchaeia archaeon]
MYEFKGVKIIWLGHDAFRIEGSKRVYIDPYQLKGGPAADVVLVTHEHFDHLSMEDLGKIVSPQTVIVASPPCKSQLSTLKVAEVVTVKPNDTVEVRGVRVHAVPAYNLNKFRQPGVPFHPKNQDHVGYVFT